MTPFSLAIPQEQIDDLNARLALTRFPDEAPGAEWGYGTDLGFMRRLVDHWQNRFDWRETEAALNALPQFMTEVDGTPLHVIKIEGKGPNPLPLLLSHGWPGSVLEFLDVIPRLTDPAAFGGDPADAVTVIAPSLPGYALSFCPGQRRYGIAEIADVFLRLMTRLGYDRFAAQGGDWGSLITARMAHVAPERLIGIHLNMVSVPPRLWPADPDADGARYMAEMKHLQTEEMGYYQIQGTKPQTVAYGLTDSPAGLAAWLVEKFRSWTDCDGDVEALLGMDRILGLIGLYWFTGCIGASFHPYYARRHDPDPLPDPIAVPTGIALYPREIMRPPRSIARALYPDIRHWTDMPRGGHFAALEQPEAFSADLQAFLRTLRD